MRKVNVIKKIAWWVGGVLLFPILLFIILSVLLYLPPVQNWAIQQVASYASEKMGMDISVGRVGLSFPLDLSITQFKAIQPNDSLPQVRDTIADVDRLVVDVQLKPLFNKKVVVNTLELTKTKINTANFIHSARIKGRLDRLYVSSRGIDLDRQTVDVTAALLDNAHVNVELSDTVPPDTTPSENKWKIYVKTLDIHKSDVAIHMPNDTLQINAYMGQAKAEYADIDLEKECYQVRRLDWTDGTLSYDNHFEPRLKGFDYNHIALNNINIGLDSIFYQAPITKLVLRQCTLKEKSGIEITQFQTRLQLDSLKLKLPKLQLRTPYSQVSADVDMDLNVMDNQHPGIIDLRLMASLGKSDIMQFLGSSMPAAFVRKYPNRPLFISGKANGNMRKVKFQGLNVMLPTAFTLVTEGQVANLIDVNKLIADVKLNGKTYDLSFITCLLDPKVMRNYRIPSGITIDGNVKVRQQNYAAQLTLREGKGKINLQGQVNLKSEDYQAQLDVKDVNIHHFMPKDSIYTLSTQMTARGKGFDILSPKSQAYIDAHVAQFKYGSWNLGGIQAKAILRQGVGHAEINSHNPMLDGTINLDALVRNRIVQATLNTDVKKVDLHAMRMVPSPLILGLCSHLDMASNLKNYHRLQGVVNDLTVADKEKTYHPTDVYLDIHTSRDTTWATVSSGNLELRMNAKGGYEQLLKQGDKIIAELQSHIKNKVIDQAKLRECLPLMQLHLMSGGENPFANFMRMKGIQFDELNLDLVSSPIEGLNGGGYIHRLIADSVQIDTIAFQISQDSTHVNFNGRVENNKKNPQFVFKTLFAGGITDKGAEVNIRYFDSSDRLGVSLGANAEMVDSGIAVHLTPYQAIVGYKEFDINNDNFVFFGRDKRVQAKVDLIAKDGTGVKIFSGEQQEDLLQDITVSLNKFDLGKITSVLPYAPSIDGLLNGDFRVMQTKNEKISVLSDLTVNKMAYEHCPIGNIGSEFVYLQTEDNAHSVEGLLTHEGKEVGTLSGTYKNENGGLLDAKLKLQHLPMSIVNGFIPDQLLGFEGYADGEMTVVGELNKPNVNGELYLDSAYLLSTPYGMHLRFDNDPVRVVNSNLLLENFNMYAHNDNPLSIYGNVNFADLDQIKLSLKMRAQNYLLIDAKKAPKAVAYGKAYVNFFANVNGDLDNIKMRGSLDILGKTDMTYVLRDSPLNTDDQLKDLVTFTNFNDTTKHVEAARPPINGLDMLLLMNVESGARVKCALNADQSNYVDLEGGGELRMTYTASDNLQLYGRYTINSGEMKYALPIIPLKTFQLQQGSYVEFKGDIFNPKLNITAIEQVKALVAQDGGNNRSVLFNCGVKVTQTLSNMGLEFTLDAPEDMTMKNELASKGADERGKLAVTMLTTGIYMSDDNTSNLSMNSALNSFLQSEINNITSSAMRTTDISLGMDQGSDATGNTYTDYSFKFAKRLWNNRVNFVIGGKISDANNASKSNEDNAFINNVSLEYRLDQSAQRYVRLFYNKEAQDLLEDRISEYGAGFVWRKKMNGLKELFTFGNKKNQGQIQMKSDSIKKK